MKNLFVSILALIMAAEACAAPKPNILFMTADDMHWDSVGVYQSPVKGITPHLDRLAHEGFMFRHAYVQIAICTSGSPQSEKDRSVYAIRI